MVGVLVLASAACGGSSPSSSTSATATSGAKAHALVATGLVGKRYCDVLLVHLTGTGLEPEDVGSHDLDRVLVDDGEERLQVESHRPQGVRSGPTGDERQIGVDQRIA